MAEKKNNRVTIFSNGIADFQRVFQTTGEPQKLELPVNKDHIGDILASLIVSGPVNLTVPPCFSPENEQTGKLTLSQDNVFQDIFRKLRGAEVEITEGTSEPTIGRIFGLDAEEVASGGEATNRYFGQVLTASGELKRVLQGNVKSIKFTQESVQSEVDKALARAFQSIRPQSTTVAMEVCSEQKDKDFFLHYTVPAAAWKMTYRLRDTGGGILFDGVGVVDNNTEEDWNDFLIGLVVGEPVTFSTDVATSKTPQRGNINLVSDQAQSGVEVERGYSSSPLRAKSMAASAMAFDESEADCALESMEMERERERERERGMGAAPAMEADAGHREVGDFSIFEFNSPLTIKAGQSATVPVFNDDLGDAADSVLFYKPDNHPERPFRAIRFKNTTDQNLGRGVCTVYEKGTYAGSAILNATKKGEDALLCHALETGVRVRFTPGQQESETASIKISDGMGIQIVNWQRRTEYTLKNIKEEEFKVVLDHQKVWGKDGKLTCSLSNEKIVARGGAWRWQEPSESMKNGDRFEFKIDGNGVTNLVVVENYTQENRLNVHDHFINNSIIRAEHPLLKDPGIQALIELQQSVQNARQKEVELTDALETSKEEQERARELIESDPDNAQWKTDLSTNETEIRAISREKLPAAQKATQAAQEAVQQALRNLVCEWSK